MKLITLAIVVALLGAAPAASAKPHHGTALQSLEQRITKLERRQRKLVLQLHQEQAARTQGDDDLYNGAFWTQLPCAAFVPVNVDFGSATAPASFLLFPPSPSYYMPIVNPGCLGLSGSGSSLTHKARTLHR